MSASLLRRSIGRVWSASNGSRSKAVRRQSLLAGKRREGGGEITTFLKKDTFEEGVLVPQHETFIGGVAVGGL